VGRTPEQASWWTEEEPERRAELALEWCRNLEKRHGARQRDREARNKAIYRGDWVGKGTPVATVINVGQQVVDSFTSDCTRERCRVQFQTRRADWHARERSLRMGEVVETDIAEAGLYDDEGIEWCRDGHSLGEGVVKVTIDYESERTRIERIRSSRVFADARDARLGRPRCWGYFESYPPEELAAMWPDHADTIEDADDAPYDLQVADGRDEGQSPTDQLCRRVMVYECWHLPSQSVRNTADKAEWQETAKHDGRHMVLIASKEGNGVTALVDEKWPLPRTLLVMYRPDRAQDGWHGFSKIERLDATQCEINLHEARTAGMMQLFSRLYMAVNKRSGLEVSKVTNDWAGILEVDGDPRTAIMGLVFPSVPPELIQRTERLEQKARDYSGKSELTMMGQKPPGVESGIALEHLIDQDSVRNNPNYRRWQAVYCDLAEVLIDCYALLAMRNPSWQARWNAENDFGKTKWNEISLERDRYKVRPMPANLFPSTPSGQIDAAVKLIDAGALPPSQLGRVLGERFADIGALTETETAAQRCIEAKLASVIRLGEVTAENEPTEFVDLALGHRTALAKLNQAEADGVEQIEIIAALKQWAAMAKDKLDALGPPPAPPGAPGGQMGAPPPGPIPIPPTGAAPPLPSPGMAA